MTKSVKDFLTKVEGLGSQIRVLGEYVDNEYVIKKLYRQNDRGLKLY